MGPTPEKMKRPPAAVGDKVAANKNNANALSEQQRKYQLVFRGLIAPSGKALEHPAADILLQLATHGCTAECGEPWTMEMLEAAIAKGSHPSARVPEAAAQLRSETLEKVEQGYARLELWEELKKNPPRNLKVSPVAAIPHKSRTYRCILDLSHGVRLGKEKFASVNESTNPMTAPRLSMAQLGNVLPRLICFVATAPVERGPLVFSKLDIKDGYWRGVVRQDEEWNFAYVLPPATPDEPIQLVIPSSLQMGWTDSPSYFCAASKTGRDVAESLVNEPEGSLEAHPLEHMMTSTETFPEPPEREGDISDEQWARLMEVYVDDFIQAAQTTDPDRLLHMSRAILHGIHSVFPPPAVTGHDGEDPVSQKKLEQGDGRWATRKEILGWIFDGQNRTIELPTDKVDKITAELHSTTRKAAVPRKDFEKLRGKLRHACIGLPAGKGLMGPIDAALTGDRHFIKIRDNPLLLNTLRDFATLIGLLAARPTHCRELIVSDPGYLGYVDASKLGAGGVWLPGILFLLPIVWRVEWPQDIRDNVVSFANPTGTITNSDLEMAGMVIQYLVLEHLACLRHVHVAAWCDNTPTVSWTNKLSSSRSMVASRLARALALRIHANEASPLISVSIAGVNNQMADIASRTFRGTSATSETFTLSDDEFLQKFSNSFPLQNASWRGFRVSSKLSSRIFSELRGETSTLGSWLQITTKGSAIGVFGSTTSPRSVVWTPCSPHCQTPTASNSFSDSLTGSGTATTGTALKSELAPFKSRFVRSARPSNWMESVTLPIAAKESTGSKFNESSKPTSGKTRHHNTSLPSL
jgi:hypothetical protein